MLLNQFLLLSAFLFCTGVYGVLTRKHTVLVLMSIELMLAAVNLNLSGGTGSTYVGKLTTLNFAEIPSPGTLRASDLLFPEGA